MLCKDCKMPASNKKCKLCTGKLCGVCGAIETCGKCKGTTCLACVGGMCNNCKECVCLSCVDTLQACVILRCHHAYCQTCAKDNIKTYTFSKNRKISICAKCL